jgi:hypothetical protein
MQSRLIPLVVLALGLSCSASREADSRVPGEIARLEDRLAKLEPSSVPEMLRSAVAPAGESVANAKGAAEPQLRLYRLRSAFINVETLAYVTEHAQAGSTVESLETLWRAREASVRTPALAARPLLESALAQASANRAGRLYRASLPYGKVAGALSGLYYLAEAEANATFARFIAELPPAEAESAPEAARLEAVLQSLESEMLTAFEQDPGGRAAIPVSVRLKEARELLDGGLTAGATLLLLEARLELSRIARAQAAGEVAMPEGIPDDSMAALWRARSDDVLVRRDVLPLYIQMRRPR